MPKLFEYTTLKNAPRDKVWLDPTLIESVEYSSATTAVVNVGGISFELRGTQEEVAKLIEAHCQVPR